MNRFYLDFLEIIYGRANVLKSISYILLQYGTGSHVVYFGTYLIIDDFSFYPRSQNLIYSISNKCYLLISSFFNFFSSWLRTDPGPYNFSA